MRDLIIVGGGASGLAAAVYALGKRLDVLVIADRLGGKVGQHQRLADETSDERFPGEETVEMFARQVSRSADRLVRDHAIAIAKDSDAFRISTVNSGLHAAVAVIIATGARPIRLNVPGAEALFGYGLGYSVTTHAHLLAGKAVAVIGATVRAQRGVAELARSAAHVSWVIPDTSGVVRLRAGALAHRANVTLYEGYQVCNVAGTIGVESIEIESLSLVGRNTRKQLTVEAAFVDIGLQPNSAMVRDLVRTDRDGFVWVDHRNATTMRGLFAAGDVTTAFGEQMLIAIGEGARAGLSAYDYLLSQALVSPAAPAAARHPSAF